MHGRGSDQGGRWPVGIWFALVGISAGTVASFAMVGWTFTRGLYTGDDGAEPVEIESGTVVIEGDEPPATPGEIEGIAGAEPVPGGLAEPGEGVEPVAAEPQAELVQQHEREPEEAPGAPVEEGGEEGGEEAEPPRLVPVDEDPCGPEESGETPGEDEEDDGGDAGNDWDHGDWDQDWNDGGWEGGWDDWDHGGWSSDGARLDPELEVEFEVELDLEAPQELPTGDGD
ncbi:hypothetical protein [Glycomyces sp. NPDC047010]|uniref:hypothetical protein n=1 Tax=Glycomyces sp. NPDC047010 TaxID=3155023 RepID=UPI003408B302